MLTYFNSAVQIYARDAKISCTDMLKNLCICFTNQRKCGSTMDAQADLSLDWEHRAFYWFCYALD